MNNILFAPCQLVIQDAELGHSLIAVFHEIKMQFPPGTEIPSNAVIPRDWAIFTKWEMSSDEEGKDYVSNTDIFWPDGSMFATFSLHAKPPVATGMAFIVRLQGFPMGQAGLIRITNRVMNGEVLVAGPIERSIRIHREFNLLTHEPREESNT